MAAALAAVREPAHRLARFPPTSDQNPYQRLLYRYLGAQGVALVPEAVFTSGWLWRHRRDVQFLHFHWRPDRYYHWPDDYNWRRRPPRPLRVPLGWLKLAGFGLRLLLGRALGYTIVWTIHEVFPQTTISRRLDRSAARILSRFSHIRFAHDHATVERARREIGNAVGDVAVVPHGSYIGYYRPGRPRAEVRGDLGIPAETFAFLCFGSLRVEKQIDFLLEAFAGLDGDVALVIAGVPKYARFGQVIREHAARDGRIRPVLLDVPDDRVAELFDACDASVHPRGDGWTSGSLILALSQGTAVVAARQPAYEELMDGETAGWLFEPNDAGSLREALAAAAGSIELAQQKGAAARRRAERLLWTDVAGSMVSRLRPPPAARD